MLRHAVAKHSPYHIKQRSTVTSPGDGHSTGRSPHCYLKLATVWNSMDRNNLRSATPALLHHISCPRIQNGEESSKNSFDKVKTTPNKEHVRESQEDPVSIKLTLQTRAQLCSLTATEHSQLLLTPEHLRDADGENLNKHRDKPGALRHFALVFCF